MIKIAICDDNATFAKDLADKLRMIWAQTFPDNVVCDEISVFSNAGAVEKYILDGHTVNIIFLDINMPDVNGFELAASLNQCDPDIIIIFVSANDTLVYNSFEYSPFRFLRKSHLKDELPKALAAAVKRCMYAEASVVFCTTEGEEFVRLSDILYVESQRNYFLVRQVGGKVSKCRGTMSDAEELLKGHDFFRIHSGFLVNMENIASIKSRMSVKLINSEELPVSRRRSDCFKEAYIKFAHKKFGI